MIPRYHLPLVNAAAYLREQSVPSASPAANLILATALEAPFFRMVESFGRGGQETLLTIRSIQQEQENSNIGYNGDEDSFVDLVEAGAVIPTETVVTMMRTAVRLATDRLASARYTDEVVRQLSSSEPPT